MEEKNEIYLKIIQGEELTERENTVIREEMENDPGLSLLLDQLRKIYRESGDIPKEYLDDDMAWNRFKEKIEPQKRQKRDVLVLQWWKYAAVFIGLLVVGYGVFRQINSEQLVVENVATGDQIVLQLADGKTVVLDETETFSITALGGEKIGHQRQDELHYGGAGHEVATEEFNRLTVPYGKRFKIYLSDGTRVHVNSGTTIRYPVTFGKEGVRQVFLEEGEAYFAVTRDESQPFLVNTSQVDVRVLGTEFNVSSYDEDESVRTVLVNGAVEVSAARGGGPGEAKNLQLTPGEMVSFDKSSGKMSIESVETINYTAWKDDRMVFVDEPFAEIVKKIERSYGVVVINNNRSLDQGRFYGDFDILKESVEDVLQVFSTSRPFHYSTSGNVITIEAGE